MNRSELVRLVARRSSTPVKAVEEVLASTLDLIALSLATGEDVNLRGFGKFKLSHRKPTTLLNPRTLEAMTIEGRCTTIFVPSPGLKDRLNATP